MRDGAAGKNTGAKPGRFAKQMAVIAGYIGTIIQERSASGKKPLTADDLFKEAQKRFKADNDNIAAADLAKCIAGVHINSAPPPAYEPPPANAENNNTGRLSPGVNHTSRAGKLNTRRSASQIGSTNSPAQGR